MPSFNLTDMVTQLIHHLCLPICAVAQRDATGHSKSLYTCEIPSLVDHVSASVGSALVIESLIQPSSNLEIFDDFWNDPERSPKCGIVKLEDDLCIAVVESATDLETLDYSCSGALVRGEQRLLVWDTNGRRDIPSLCALLYDRLSDKIGALEDSMESQQDIVDQWLDLDYKFERTDMLPSSPSHQVDDPWIADSEPFIASMGVPFHSHRFWQSESDGDQPILFTPSKEETWRRPRPLAGSPISSPESSPATSSNSSLPGSPSASHSPFPESSPSSSYPILFTGSYASHIPPHAPDVPLTASPKDIFPELADEVLHFSTNISIFGTTSFDTDEEPDDAQTCPEDAEMAIAADDDAQADLNGMDTSDDELSEVPSAFSRESSPELPLSAAPRHTSHQQRAPSLDVDPWVFLAWQTASRQTRAKARDGAAAGTPSSSTQRPASRSSSSSRTSRTASLSPAPSAASTSGSGRKRKHSEPTLPEDDDREDEHADDEDNGAFESDGDDAYDPPSEPEDDGDGEYCGGRTKRQRQKRPAQARPTKPLPRRARGSAPAARAPRKARDVASGEGPCPCTHPGCTQLFGRRHDMLRHISAVHNLEEVPCEGCRKEFSRVDSLRRHLLADCPTLGSLGSSRALAKLEARVKAEKRAKKTAPTEKPQNERRSKRSCDK
ncbi:hypothetical protein PsYK624_074850 [Phanerochaete sordida]|uniref:C2H2-type domain-containing protein n=1 Tax=Phanerochaete sordida TaxID=48140 RepID=A0A9P3GAR3_9APHY|nr:hypothetical protein PsYK624_074850 [Phanerochaete sordida]